MSVPHCLSFLLFMIIVNILVPQPTTSHCVVFLLVIILVTMTLCVLCRQ